MLLAHRAGEHLDAVVLVAELDARVEPEDGRDHRQPEVPGQRRLDRRADEVGEPQQGEVDVGPAPDVAVEIDLHHESLYKFPIYAALGVSEVWRYDGVKLEIHELENGKYITKEKSAALPILTAELLTDFLNRSRTETQSKILFAFEDWLKEQA